MSGHSPTPWEVVEANENHGAYVVNVFGGDVCDLYAMSNPSAWSVSNGGDSRAVPFLDADANARLIVKAVNSHDALVEALKPFALNPGAVSLSKALGHISREHLLAARDAIETLKEQS